MSSIYQATVSSHTITLSVYCRMLVGIRIDTDWWYGLDAHTYIDEVYDNLHTYGQVNLHTTNPVGTLTMVGMNDMMFSNGVTQIMYKSVIRALVYALYKWLFAPDIGVELSDYASKDDRNVQQWYNGRVHTPTTHKVYDQAYIDLLSTLEFRPKVTVDLSLPSRCIDATCNNIVELTRNVVIGVLIHYVGITLRKKRLYACGLRPFVESMVNVFTKTECKVDMMVYTGKVVYMPPKSKVGTAVEVSVPLSVEHITQVIHTSYHVIAMALELVTRMQLALPRFDGEHVVACVLIAAEYYYDDADIDDLNCVCDYPIMDLAYAKKTVVATLAYSINRATAMEYLDAYLGPMSDISYKKAMISWLSASRTYTHSGRHVAEAIIEVVDTLGDSTPDKIVVAMHAALSHRPVNPGTHIDTPKVFVYEPDKRGEFDDNDYDYVKLNDSDDEDVADEMNNLTIKS